MEEVAIGCRPTTDILTGTPNGIESRVVPSSSNGGIRPQSSSELLIVVAARISWGSSFGFPCPDDVHYYCPHSLSLKGERAECPKFFGN